MESSDGFVISELAYFKDGLDFLVPGGEISCYWDHRHSFLPLLKEKGFDGEILITTRYKDLTGDSYETACNLKPTIYRDDRYVHNKGIEDVARPSEDLVKNVEELSWGPKRPVGDQEKHGSTAGGARREEP